MTVSRFVRSIPFLVTLALLLLCLPAGAQQNPKRLIMKDGSDKPLTFREVANKVIHSSRLEWELLKCQDPLLLCHTRDKEQWLRAEIDLVAFAAVCGQLMS